MVLQGYTVSASEATKDHRVKVTVTGICDSVLMDTVNGLYLRKGEQVFVYFADNYLSPLVIGRVSGQFELKDLCEILNNFINTYNNHVHADFAVLKTFFTTVAAGAIDPIVKAAASAASSSLNTDAPLTKVSTVTPDDFLY